MSAVLSPYFGSHSSADDDIPPPPPHRPSSTASPSQSLHTSAISQPLQPFNSASSATNPTLSANPTPTNPTLSSNPTLSTSPPTPRRPLLRPPPSAQLSVPVSPSPTQQPQQPQHPHFQPPQRITEGFSETASFFDDQELSAIPLPQYQHPTQIIQHRHHLNVLDSLDSSYDNDTLTFKRVPTISNTPRHTTHQLHTSHPSAGAGPTSAGHHLPLDFEQGQHFAMSPSALMATPAFSSMTPAHGPMTPANGAMIPPPASGLRGALTPAHTSNQHHHFFPPNSTPTFPSSLPVQSSIITGGGLYSSPHDYGAAPQTGTIPSPYFTQHPTHTTQSQPQQQFQPMVLDQTVDLLGGGASTPSNHMTRQASTVSTGIAGGGITPLAGAAAGNLASSPSFCSSGIRSQYFPDNPQHSRILQLVRSRSTQLYNSLYKTNKAYCNSPRPEPDLYSKLVHQSQMITSSSDVLYSVVTNKQRDKEKRSGVSGAVGLGSLSGNMNSGNSTNLDFPPLSSGGGGGAGAMGPALPISEAVHAYPGIVASCLDDDVFAASLIEILNSIFDLHRAHALDWDTASTVEAAFAYHHHKLEQLQHQEEDSRRRAIIALKEYLAIKQKEERKKVEKSALNAFQALRRYEFDRKESCYQLAHTDLEATRSVIKPLYIRLQAHYDYFQRGWSYIEPFTPIINRLKQICDEQDRLCEQERLIVQQHQNQHDEQMDIYLKKTGLETIAAGEFDFGNDILSTNSTTGLNNSSSSLGANNNNTAGFRDLENNRQVERAAVGTEKSGYLFTPPPQHTRVWVELRDKVLRVSEEQISTTKPSQSGSTSTLASSTSGLSTLLAAGRNSIMYSSNTSLLEESHSFSAIANASSPSGGNGAISGSGGGTVGIGGGGPGGNVPSGALYRPQSSTNYRDDLLANAAQQASSSLKVIFEQPVMLLTAKAVRESKYRFVFQFISPQGTCTLQAESDAIVREWLDVIQNAIDENLKIDQHENAGGAGGGGGRLSILPPLRAQGSAVTNSGGGLITDTSSISGQMSSLDINTTVSVSGYDTSAYDANQVLSALRTVPGNTVCCDCGSANPDWISINLGVLMCLDCSGVHRQLGVGISKVRSVMMDKLDPHVIQYCSSVGNSLANSIFLELYHHEKDNAIDRHDPTIFITPTSSRQDKTEHIRAKYQIKRWVLPDLLILPHKQTLEQVIILKTRLSTLLYNGVRADDMTSVYRAVICGADVTFALHENDNIPPLFESILYNAPQFLTCMLQFTHDYNFTDERGWCCLHYAAYVASLQMCEIVLSFAGSECSMLRDGEGNTPRNIALAFNADIPNLQSVLPQLVHMLEQFETKYQRRLAKNGQ